MSEISFILRFFAYATARRALAEIKVIICVKISVSKEESTIIEIGGISVTMFTKV